jgi:NitT/TauT family transport system substrate-binding protein
MKKITALLLALAMVFSMAACGSTTSSTESTATESEAAATTEEATVEEEAAPAEEEAADAEEAPAEEESVEEEAEAVEPVTLRIAYMPNYASLWSVLTGINMGYFDEEGITIELTEFQDGPSEIAAMEGGSIDLAYIGKGAHKLCIQGRAEIFAPSSVHTSDTVIVSAESGIESLEDLAGKKIAFNSGSSSETTLDSALSLGGLTRDDVELYDMDVTYMVSAMVSGSVDAAVAWNPYTNQILTSLEGSQEIEFSNGSINMSSWICLPGWSDENHDVLVRFCRALYKAMDYASNSDNWEEVAQWCADQTKTDVDANLAQTGDAVWFDTETLKADLEDGTLVEYYEHVQQDFVDSETITEDEVVDVNEWVLFDIMSEALGE